MLLRSQPVAGSGNGPALPELHRRLKWVALVGSSRSSLLVGRLWQLQVMRGESYYERTVSNVVKERYLPSVRGKILDRKGVAARRQPARVQHLRDAEAADAARRAGRARSRCSACPTTRSRRSTSGSPSARSATRSSRSLILEDQGRDRAALVEQAATRLPGVEVHHEPYRYYPQGDLAAHLVGYMTQMTAEEADELDRRRATTPSELVGRYGLESAWENYLRGKKGIERYAVDARGQRLDDKTAADADPGRARDRRRCPARTSCSRIDVELQQLAEKRGRARRGRRRRHRRAEDRQAPRDRVSKPSFDPNVMTGHLTRAEETLLLHRSAQAVHRQGAARDVSAGLGVQVRHRARRARGRPGRRGRDDRSARGEYELSGTHVPLQRHARQARPARRDPALVQRLLLEARASASASIASPRSRASSASARRPNLGLNGDAAGPHPDEGLVRAARPLQDRLRDERGDRAGRRRGHRAADGDGVRGARQRRHAVRAAGRRARRVAATAARSSRTSRRSRATIKIAADALDIWRRGMWKVTNEPGGTAFDHGHVDRSCR